MQVISVSVHDPLECLAESFCLKEEWGKKLILLRCRKVGQSRIWNCQSLKNNSLHGKNLELIFQKPQILSGKQVLATCNVILAYGSQSWTTGQDNICSGHLFLFSFFHQGNLPIRRSLIWWLPLLPLLHLPGPLHILRVNASMWIIYNITNSPERSGYKSQVNGCLRFFPQIPVPLLQTSSHFVFHLSQCREDQMCPFFWGPNALTMAKTVSNSWLGNLDYLTPKVIWTLKARDPQIDFAPASVAMNFVALAKKTNLAQEGCTKIPSLSHSCAWKHKWDFRLHSITNA